MLEKSKKNHKRYIDIKECVVNEQEIIAQGLPAGLRLWMKFTGKVTCGRTEPGCRQASGGVEGALGMLTVGQ